MSRYRSSEWEKLAKGRRERKSLRSRRGSHPLSHVDKDRCYEWMRAECAALESARQSREDGIIGTITQISSTALLAIPGLLFGSDQSFPSLYDAPLLYFGIAAFLVTLCLAMLEQFLSAKAYRRQTQIVSEYYLMQSDRTSDSAFVMWVRRCRNGACIMFGLAVVISAAALMMLERKADGKSTATSTATATSAAPSAAPSTSTAAPSAIPLAGVPRERRKVGPRVDPATSSPEGLNKGAKQF